MVAQEIASSGIIDRMAPQSENALELKAVMQLLNLSAP